MKFSVRIISAAVLLLMLLAFAGCEEKQTMTKVDYASSVVSLFSEYNEKFDKITEAIKNGQRVTASKLCDEASDTLDEMKDLTPSVAIKSEHEALTECCDNEQEKLELQKEYLELTKDDETAEENKERISEIQDKMLMLSAKSDLFYNTVDEIAGNHLQTKANDDGNMVAY